MRNIDNRQVVALCTGDFLGMRITKADSRLVKPAWMVLKSLFLERYVSALAGWRVALTLSVLLASAYVANAQDAGDEMSEAPRANGQKALPDILKDGTIDTTARLYLDDDGKPVLVPSETMASFIQKTRALQAESRMPDFAFKEAAVEISVEGDNAKILGKFQVTLSKSHSGVAAIPLRFSSCQLFEAPQFTGGGESLIEVNSGLSGYQWYLNGVAGSEHSATLRGGAVVPRRGARRELRLNLPFTKSTVEVRLPLNAIDDVVSGNGEEVIDRESTEQARIVRIHGSGGEMTISWRDSDARSRLSAVEAASQTRLEIDDPHQAWKCSTDLTLSWFGNDAPDNVVLNLPAGARWLQVPSSLNEHYTLSNASPSNEPAAEQSAQQIQTEQSLTIRNLDPSLIQPLRLLWEWQPPAEKEVTVGKSLQVPSITIDGVDSHTGTVEFLVPTSFAPTWQEQSGTQLVQQARQSDLLDRKQYLFRFSRQPLQLTANFRRPINVASIRPTYLAHVDGYKLRMTAWLDCMFDTSKPIAVTMLPANWQIESAELVEMSDPHAQGEPLSLMPQPDSSMVISHVDPDLMEFNEQRSLRQVWRVIAYRPWEPAEANQFTLKLPELQQSEASGNERSFDHGTGILIVTSTSNLLLKNNAAETKGLLVDSLVPQWQPLLSSDAANQPLVYRFQSRGEHPFWSGAAEPLPQQIVLQQQAAVDVGSELIRVTQDYALQIANEPLNQLRIAIRQDSLGVVEPQVMINGVPVQLQLINKLGQTVQSEPTTRAMEVSLQSSPVVPESNGVDQSSVSTADGAQTSQPSVAGAAVDNGQNAATSTVKPTKPEANAWRIFEPVSVAPLRGNVTVNIRTAVPWKASGQFQLTEIGVPLVQLIVPRATRLREQTWSAKADRAVEVFEIKSTDLTQKATAEENGSERETRLVAVPAEPQALEVGQVELRLSARKLESLAYFPVRIGRSWLQTIINGNERRDRYTAQIESTLPRISIRVPGSRNVKHVIVDGKPVTQELTAVFTSEGTQYQIDLPTNDKSVHQIEVWMISAEALAWLTPLEIDVPEIEGAQFYDRFYWQLAIPSIQHFGFATGRMTPEWNWQFRSLWWNRESRLKQADLERWVGATQQTELPTSVNKYVLSSFGGGRSFQIWVVSRFLLWLPIGLASIVLSVLLVSFRALRHPAFLLLGAGGIATAAMLAPDLAVLLGQTAVVSLVLVFLILITQAAIEVRVRRRSVFTVRPSNFSERSDHFSLARNVKLSSAPSSTRAHSSVIADGGK